MDAINDLAYPELLQTKHFKTFIALMKFACLNFAGPTGHARASNLDQEEDIFRSLYWRIKFTNVSAYWNLLL